MSLILEALRRHGEENGHTPSLPLATSSPPPLPPPSPRRASFGLLALLGIVILVSGSYAWYALRPHPKPTTTATTAAPIIPTAAKRIVPAATSSNIAPTIMQGEARHSKTNVPPPALARPSPPAVAAVVPPQPLPTTNVLPAVTVPQPLSQPEAVNWPKLVVTGVMGRTGNRLVLINGKMLKVDDEIGGARVISVTENGVWLTFQGATNFIHVGDGAK